MKRSILLLVAACLMFSNNVSSQNLLKKVGQAVANEVLGSGTGSASAKAEPEPSCACDDAELIVDLGGSLKINYKEANISTMDDGALLLQDKMSGNYYIARNGVIQGPMQAGDPKIAGFENSEEEGTNKLLLRYKDYISKSGDKYLITFGGKKYGPYGQINGFAVTRSKEKFAALVVENVVVSEMDGEAMDNAMKNAKSDQERMQLAMKYSQQMQQKIMQGGGPSSMTTKLVSNVSDLSFDPINQPATSLNGTMKFDEILLPAYNKIYNLQGQVVVTLKNEHIGAENIFVRSDNTKYAIYNYGTITYSDGKTLTDLFNPHLIKNGGQVYLAYMYYSPKRNAIMQCKIPF
jgi:hypothetical protein